MPPIRKKFTNIASRSTGLLAFLILWELVPRLGWVKPIYLTPPSGVAQALWHLARNGDLWKHATISLQRILISLVLSTIVGTILGLFIGYFRRIERHLDLLFQAFRQMSAFALFPVFILIFGLGELSKTIIIFWASLWPILLNTSTGVRNVDKVLIRSVQSMGASKSYIFLHVILPAAAPEIFTGIRLGGSYCVMAVVAAEMIGALSGLGWLVIYSQDTFNTADMYAGIVGLAIIGMGLNYILTSIENHFTRWRKNVSAGE